MQITGLVKSESGTTEHVTMTISGQEIQITHFLDNDRWQASRNGRRIFAHPCTKATLVKRLRSL